MASIFNCVLCGIAILRTSNSQSQKWLNDYRAVYRHGADTSVSGVGCFEYSGPWVAPLDPSIRWDTKSESDTQMHIPVMRQPVANGIHGFILHDVCWQLLKRASEPTGLSLERLMSVYESLPFPLGSNGVSWGHGYNDLSKIDGIASYPWMERFSPASIQAILKMGAMDDPLNIGSLFPIISKATMSDIPNVTSKLLDQHTDCFSRLPWELCEMILMNLPTQDALRLRLASPSFLPLYSSFAFWSSRFEPDGEKGFLFEATKVGPARDRDTDRLLDFYQIPERTLGLLNRRRVWALARWLVPLIKPLSLGNKIVSTLPPPPLSDTADLGDWIQLKSKIQSLEISTEWQAFDEGSRPTASTTIDIPTGGMDIGISLIDMGRWDYITGIRIISADGNQQILGHLFDAKERLCHVSELHGFRVAMGPSGVRAMQVIGENEQTSRWVGRVDQLPISGRLVADAQVTGISVTFDGYKLTSLAIRVRQSNPHTMSLRRAAIWYPNIIPHGLVLNEDSFTGENPLSTGYQPLSWIHFGGRDGTAMPQVRGIQAKFTHYVLGLQVIYNEAHERRYSDILGPGGEIPLSGTSPPFPIDGADGERIDSVSVGIRRYTDTDIPSILRHGLLDYIEAEQITTNRDRTMCIGKYTDDLEMRPLSIAPGTTITGFYGHHDATYGLISLGVISEHLGNSSYE